MKTIMDDSQITTVEQVEQFLDGTGSIAMSISLKSERYDWMRRTLVRFSYLTLCRSDRGTIRRYLIRVSGYSRAQVTRLVKQYVDQGVITRGQSTSNGFSIKYTREDVRLLSKLDNLHGHMSGPATKKLCERACHVFGDMDYARLAEISVSHLYNIRQSAVYLGGSCSLTKTRATNVKIGVRRKPVPGGRPGFIRVDTVHQGDFDGEKGVYYVNTVDEVTQFEVIGCVERITEEHLVPLLKSLLDQRPFVILGFHSDNGSEYVNRKVAELLNKMLIAFTKSRSRQTNDNALVESKNGCIVRKHFGRGHIPRKFAEMIHEHCIEVLNPYINFHRPCYFPETFTDKKGKVKNGNGNLNLTHVGTEN